MGNGCCGLHRAFNSLDCRAACITAQVCKPRQRKRRQNPQNHNHHNQLDQGKTALLFLHFDAPKAVGITD